MWYTCLPLKRCTALYTGESGLRYLIENMALLYVSVMGATGFDMVDLKCGASRGLLATLNRGTVNLIGKKQEFALAA